MLRLLYHIHTVALKKLNEILVTGEYPTLIVSKIWYDNFFRLNNFYIVKNERRKKKWIIINVTVIKMGIEKTTYAEYYIIRDIKYTMSLKNVDRTLLKYL